MVEDGGQATRRWGIATGAATASDAVSAAGGVTVARRRRESAASPIPIAASTRPDAAIGIRPAPGNAIAITKATGGHHNIARNTPGGDQSCPLSVMWGVYPDRAATMHGVHLTG